MNKIAYIANIRLPTEKAHGLQIMKTCEALVKYGMEVELIISNREDVPIGKIFDYYNIKRIFSIKKITVPKIPISSKIGFLIYSLIFSIRSALYILKSRPTVIYSRDILPLFFLSNKKLRLYFEAHTGGWNIITSKVLNKVNGIICITNGLRNLYISHNIDPNKITVIPDAVDLADYVNLPDSRQCRRELNLPESKMIVMYAGSFNVYKWKGLDVFLEASKYIDQKYLFVAIGGTSSEIAKLKEKGLEDNIILLERVSNNLIPKYLKSADILVIPNKAGDIVSREYTSPMKLFEYMASGVPILASDLPSIREVLNSSSATFFKPDNPVDLARNIDNILDNYTEAKKKADQALIDVKVYDWNSRAERIIEFVFS